jgi:ribosomal protein L11 methyltransferase
MSESGPDQYVEAKVTVPRSYTDAVCDFIIEHFSSGLILEDEEDSVETTITYYVPGDHNTEHATRLTNYLIDILPETLPTPLINERTIKNIEWVQQYRDSLEPIVIGEDICIRPPWMEAPSPVPFDIVIEPKMAFGTGSHETTRSCLQAVRHLVKPGDTFLDLGCGSGILSILAARLGAGFIRAIDYDPVAVDNTIENFALNGVIVRHETIVGSIEQAHAPEPYDVVVANIIKMTILPWIPQLLQLTRPGGRLVLSGLLESDVDDISQALKTVHQTNFEIIPDNAWRTFVVTRS